jgi:hypothetical protein
LSARHWGYKKDANHDELVAVFERMGASVFDTSAVGRGFTDIVIGMAGFNVLVEIKDGNKTASKKALGKAQVEFRGAWRGWYEVVESVDDVLALLNKIRLKQIARAAYEKNI